MRPSNISFLIFGVSLLKSYLCVEICSGNQYTVHDANGKFVKCQYCDECHEGYGLEPKCGSIVQSPVNKTYCKPCTTGTFSNKYDSSPCYECQHCAKHEIVTADCNSQSDTNCSGTCDIGYYFAKDASHACHECSYCCSDGKDEVQPECVRHAGFKARNQHCSRRVDKNCDPELPSGKNNTKKDAINKNLGAILGGVFGGVTVIVVIIIIIWAIWKRRSRSDEVPIRDHETPMIAQAVVNASDVKDSTMSTPLENGNVVIQDEAAALNSHPTRPVPQLLSVSSLNPAFVPSNPGTPHVLPKQFIQSHDSQTSKGQIKIVQQPKSQNQTEGSRVEFTYKCKVAEKIQVFYQWFKDGTELQEQSTFSLVLKSVKMRDFGCYRCHVKCIGDEGEGIKSDPAILEVVPCDGMKFKFLRDVDLDRRDDIATYLENVTPGLGGWRQIAAKYGMEEHQIGGLAQAHVQGPGQRVMEFLHASQPHLTVYSFCKTLKESKMKRFDIVRVLEGDLSIEKESA